MFAITQVPGVVTVWATGLGGQTPEARLAGGTVPVLYAGPAPGFLGLDQINIQVLQQRPPMRLELSVGGETFVDINVSLP
jgi:uncharacterized protein (TIGR03437 family)